MEYRIQFAPVFSVLEFQLNEAEEVVAQPDSMISLTPGIQITAAVGSSNSDKKWKTGFKSLLGGESFFRAVFRAKRDGQSLMLAPENYGDVLPIEIDDTGGLLLSRGSYLAHFGNCQLDAKYGGLKGIMAKTGLFLLHISGSGTLFCQTYGAIIERKLAAEEQFLVDNRYVVAFSDTMTFEVVKSSDSVKDSLLSGEAFVNRFTGPGRLYYQTRVKPVVGFFNYLLSAMT